MIQPHLIDKELMLGLNIVQQFFIIQKFKRKLPADVKACFWWLQNRQPRRWSSVENQPRRRVLHDDIDPIRQASCDAATLGFTSAASFQPGDSQ